jgi:hypothetical protein
MKSSKPKEKISPTEALRILMTQMAAPAAAKRLTHALHNYWCCIWCNGKLVGRNQVAHLSVLDICDDADPDHWHAVVGDDRWDSAPSGYELDATEVRDLLLPDPSGHMPALTRRRGPPVRDEWFTICGEIAFRCIDPKTGRIRVPKNQSKFAEDVLLWCQNEHGLYSALTTVREAVKRVCAALAKAQK